jgi:hypothetical protein
MTQLKSAASRRVNILGFDHPLRKRWARHGSTRRLFNDESVRRAISYVVEEQGQPMAVFEVDHSRWSRLCTHGCIQSRDRPYGRAKYF